MSEFLEDIKRVPWISSGRFSDAVVSNVCEHFFGDILPQFWSYRSKEHFLKQFGMGRWWSRTQSFHMYVSDGERVARFWTDLSNSCRVDLSPELIPTVRSYGLVISDIPKSTLRKSFPFTKRTVLRKEEQVVTLVTAIEQVFGVPT